jgi:FkbM family methyltransferase
MSEPASQQSAVIQHLQDSIAYLFKSLTRTRQELYAMRAAEKLQKLGRKPALPIKFTSQFGEDLLAWDLLDGQLDGFFIEVGAFDGYRYSVTYPFESVGWQGLLIEAHPSAYQLCAKRRPRSRVVHTALSRRGASGETEFSVVGDHYGGMLSYHKFLPEHEKYANAPQQKVTVPLTTMDDLLAHHAGAIDLAVIDVEGAEEDVLDGFDLNRFRPKILIIEANHPQEIENHMARFPYVNGGRIEANLLFIRGDQTEMLERMKWLRLP